MEFTRNTDPCLVIPATCTMTGPLVVPAGTTASISVSLHAVIVAATPLKLTVLSLWVPPKPVPVIATVMPTGPPGGS